MGKRFVYLFLTLLGCSFGSVTFSQLANPYILNGSARQESCNCYTLTEDQKAQSGSVWNKFKIDLTQPFDYKFRVSDRYGAEVVERNRLFHLQNPRSIS